MTVSTPYRLTLVDRAAQNVDCAALERNEREQFKRATDERIAYLRSVLFDNALRDSRDLNDLTSEAAAAQLLISAHESVHGRLVLGILRLAIDNRWHTAFQAGVRHFGDGSTATRFREVWEHTLARDRAAV